MTDAAADPEARELGWRALEVAKARGASYADVRVITRCWNRLSCHNGVVAEDEDGEETGLGLRCLVDGAWGFAASPVLTTAEADRIAALAVEVATASGRLPWKVSLGAPEPHTFTGRGPCLTDPFDIPYETKADLLHACDLAMRRPSAVRAATGTLDFLRERRLLLTTEGTDIYQEQVDSGGGLKVVAVRDGDMQQRSWPHIFGWHGQRGGWEVIEAMGFEENAARIGEEAAALLDAPPCPEGPATVILDASQTAMQLHESLGHALELDRALGMEAATAGTSFLTPDLLGRPVASEHVTVFADPAGTPGAGSFRFDDDGVPARRATLIERGRFVDYLSSRDTAPIVGKQSTAASRTDTWNRIPLVRMTCLNLEPGRMSFDELLDDTGEGLLLATTASWSIDERRMNFEFATEMAREIRGGKLGRLLRGPVYRGATPDFWSACDAVAGPESFRPLSVRLCFKGQPGQLQRVTNGAAPARFRDVSLLPR